MNLAASTKSAIIGFNTKPSAKAVNLAKQQGVVIDTYDIIYELIEDVTTAVVKMLEPELVHTTFGKAKVLKIFMTDKREMIVGGRVEEGDIKRASKIAIFRGGVQVGTAEIEDLQQSKSAAQIVTDGNEFGVKVKTHTKVEEGDVLESYEEKLKSKTLTSRA